MSVASLEKQDTSTIEQKEHKSSLVSKNVTIFDRRTSVRLEPEMWRALYDIAHREKCSIHALCSLIAHRKGDNSSLTAAIRVFVMLYYKAAATEEGHARCGHGSFLTMLTRAQVTPKLMAFFQNFLQKSKWKTNRNKVSNHQSPQG